ncbi:MAG: hypothetical protein ABL925_11060 [Methylococcales bacterium]
MAQNNLMGLVTGFFSNRSSSTSIYKEEVVKVINAGNGETGVARYLDAHKGRSSVSGVSKYLKKQEQTKVSSVSKYLIKQSIAERNKKATVNSTGVEKYLKAKKPTVVAVKTGVAKYLDNVQKSNVSSVSKYVVKKNIADRNKPVVKSTKVSNYLENKKEHSTSGVAKYLIRQSIAEKRAIAEQVVITKAPTGVEKYLQSRA